MRDLFCYFLVVYNPGHQQGHVDHAFSIDGRATGSLDWYEFSSYTSCRLRRKASREKLFVHFDIEMVERRETFFKKSFRERSRETFLKKFPESDPIPKGSPQVVVTLRGRRWSEVVGGGSGGVFWPKRRKTRKTARNAKNAKNTFPAVFVKGGSRGGPGGSRGGPGGSGKRSKNRSVDTRAQKNDTYGH